MANITTVKPNLALVLNTAYPQHICITLNYTIFKKPQHGKGTSDTHSLNAVLRWGCWAYVLYTLIITANFWLPVCIKSNPKLLLSC